MIRREGSSLIIVIITMTSVLLYYTVVWHSNVLLWDHLVCQYKREQIVSDVESLFLYGAGLYRLNKRAVHDQLKREQLIDIEVAWPPNDSHKKGRLVISPVQDGVKIIASLYGDAVHKLAASSGLVHITKDNTVCIEGWRLE